jgi:hypothetical protein
VPTVQCSAVQCSLKLPAGRARELPSFLLLLAAGLGECHTPAVQCSAVQCSAVQCSAVQCSTQPYRLSLLQVIGPSSCAYLALAGAQYVMKIHPSILSFMCEDQTKHVNKNWAETLIALVVICLLSAINMWSVKWAARVQNTLTVAKLIGMAVLIIGGLVNLATGDGAKNFESG